MSARSRSGSAARQLPRFSSHTLTKETITSGRDVWLRSMAGQTSENHQLHDMRKAHQSKCYMDTLMYRADEHKHQLTCLQRQAPASTCDLQLDYSYTSCGRWKQLVKVRLDEYEARQMVLEERRSNGQREVQQREHQHAHTSRWKSLVKVDSTSSFNTGALPFFGALAPPF